MDHSAYVTVFRLSVAPDQPSEFCASSVSVTYKPNGNGDSNGLYAQYTIGEPGNKFKIFKSTNKTRYF